MDLPCYINITQARAVLSELGLSLTDRQMKRAAEADVHGRRKLPFFIDPIDGRLKIEKGDLVRVYGELRIKALNNTKTLEDQFARHTGRSKE
jgi:hypothetical protein